MSVDAPAAPRRAARSRTGVVLVVLVVLAATAAVVGLLATWPGEDRRPDTGFVDVEVERLSATVVGSRWDTCDGTVEDMEPDGSVPQTVRCLHVSAEVGAGASAGTTVEVIATSGLTRADVPPGTGIVLEHYPADQNGDEVWAWGDFRRGVPLTTFALAFALVTVLVAGMRGLRALVGLAVAFGVLAVHLVPALVQGQPALVATLSAATVVVVVVLYLAHGFSLRTTTALLGTLGGLVLVTVLGVVGAHVAHLHPGSTEDTYQLARLLGDDGVRILQGVFLSGVVLAGIGVLNDVTITQASAVFELRAADPAASWRTLLARGMRIGRDHIASTVYTIAFAYAGASMPVLLLLELYDQPLGQTLTSGAFAEQVVSTLAGSIGLVLAIPLTTAVAAVAAVRLAPARISGGHRH
ncbi:YibE/F family protein [Cellulomonas fimi]|uniref:YibE/F family protein n=1 Tax=Cellulomonas fimi (strain ATCC 484 / DSM 20113 / JCM 1341 / CCUG 24087 / LMG 16345 / NBRC 15513 / NCIMB 8980 / NCTC 7547 / NRS-133) TaxID=590998 RepID=F4H879_CELFA|nr:YibE/F family protein [Cellulomonas fimi]AEE44636.1 YibE/F family protein [Cellulomonas fimi ATCC 484]NNH09099.1 YibE/F family protein [Cellulomonas fimi]VEH26853.1 YibE/F-like protein [Cellulomonas fimi]